MRQAIRYSEGISPLLNRSQDIGDVHRISERFAIFILENAKCSRCGERMNEFESHNHCVDTDFAWADVEPLVPKALIPEFTKHWKRHRWAVKHLTRTARLRATGGSHTREQLEKLLADQAARCYYCYSPLESEGGASSAHLDHFEPISLGGTDDILNLVYACAGCNTCKGMSAGQSFRAGMFRKASPELRNELRQMYCTVKRGRFKVPIA